MGFLDRVKNLITGKRSIVRNKDTGTPLERYRKSFLHALDGMAYTFVCEHNLPVIIVCGILTIIAGVLFQISNSEWLFCIAMIGAVSAAEFINTAIEAVVDLASPDFNKLAKIAKDTASSATLMLALTALAGALVIFIPKVLLCL
ncbi:MAG: diacylglycerol kinase family protein [Bacilli bacterium]|nr:diacylglycerol kinase family protein [Bacilli bacterium]